MTEGIITFDGNGTGSAKATSLVLVSPAPSSVGYPVPATGAGTQTYSFKFTYTVNRDGSWVANVVPGHMPLQPSEAAAPDRRVRFSIIRRSLV
jgi:hypothetical protein